MNEQQRQAKLMKQYKRRKRIKKHLKEIMGRRHVSGKLLYEYEKDEHYAAITRKQQHHREAMAKKRAS